MALMIVRAAGFDQLKDEISFIDSADISGWAGKGVAAAVENGIINGYPDNTFRPKGDATRAETAAIIMRALQAK